jgi:endo-1,4-beta-D-glucanase Y
VIRILSLPAGRLKANSERTFLLGLLFLAGLAHGLNMFHYPHLGWTGDEGIYTEQAWALLKIGQLSPYTYWYDHAPAGWMLYAVWMALTGGPFAFGSPAINSGRALMLALHLASGALLYRLARRLGAGPAPSGLAVFVFSCSPLAILYQRMVLLDNIMVFWLLLGFNLLTERRLSRFILAGICFGVAALTKEPGVVFLPAALLLLARVRQPEHGRFPLACFATAFILLTSSYPLYAALRGELLPSNLEPSVIAGVQPTGRHMSLIESVLWQMRRPGGTFQANLNEWLSRDPLLTWILLLSPLTAVAAFRRGGTGPWVATVACAAYLAFLARGGFTQAFFIVPLIPFGCLAMALTLGRLGHLASWLTSGGLGLLAAWFWVSTGRLMPLYYLDGSTAFVEALAWIRSHVPAESYLVMSDNFWVDLHDWSVSFPNAHSHWKFVLDPGIRDNVFKGSWRTVDYVICEGAADAVARESGERGDLLIQAIVHSHSVRTFQGSGGSCEVRKVDRPGLTELRLLDGLQTHMRARFYRDGAYTDNVGLVTSEAQAYALLRAVWTGDRAEFYRVWAWTRANLLNEKGLLSWLWQNGRVLDANSAADADVDAALALLLAGKRFNDPELFEVGRRLVQAIWAHEVTTVGRKPYLAAGDWARDWPVVPLNPSYFFPYAFRVFQEVDPGHDWLGLVDTSYEVLFATARTGAGLPPDWVGLDRATGELTAYPLTDRSRPETYGYDAARVYWRVALDLRWWGDGRARRYLELADFLRSEAERKGYVSAVYGPGGEVVEEPPSNVGIAGAVAALSTLEPRLAHRLHAAWIVGRMAPAGPGFYVGDPADIYAQEWAWFEVAFYAGAIPDLWHPVAERLSREQAGTAEPATGTGGS